MSSKDADGIDPDQTLGAVWMANNVDPDQTAPRDPDQTFPPGAIWSWSTLFVQAFVSENLGSLR